METKPPREKKFITKQRNLINPKIRKIRQWSEVEIEKIEEKNSPRSSANGALCNYSSAPRPAHVSQPYNQWREATTSKKRNWRERKQRQQSIEREEMKNEGKYEHWAESSSPFSLNFLYSFN